MNIVTIKIENEIFELKYTYKSLLELEKKGVNIFELSTGISFKQLLILIEIGMNYTGDSSILMDKLLDTYTYSELMDKIVLALHNSLNRASTEEVTEKK